MIRYLRKPVALLLWLATGALIGAIVLYVWLLENRPDLHLWHEQELDHEFSVSEHAAADFARYLQIENAVFAQLEREILGDNPATPTLLNRFSAGSAADPTAYPRNWNRTFLLDHDHPLGNILLLHGLSDSPYSLRALAQWLHSRGYRVLGLRLPGHGTAPSGLVQAKWRDMAAAVRIAARHLALLDPGTPFYLIGYSMGAALAVEYTLASLSGEPLRQPAGLVLLSPAIGVSPVAALASWQSRLGVLLGLDKLAWNSIQPEYDPYKYTSFAVNGGDLMYRLTLRIREQFDHLQQQDQAGAFPPTLAFLSVVDATVSVQAVITDLLDRLDSPANQFVLFDVNRDRQLAPFLRDDPDATLKALLGPSPLEFDLTVVTNRTPATARLMALRKPADAATIERSDLDLAWPEGVYSLSHVALPFPPDDPIYGSVLTADSPLHIGMLESKGERGVLTVPAADMLRLRHNPFFDYQRERIAAFLTTVNE